MDKRKFYLKNITKQNIRVLEFNIVLAPGVSNLFALNPNLSYEQIEQSVKYGSIATAMAKQRCVFVPEPAYSSLDPSIVIKKPEPVQIFHSRTKFNLINDYDSNLFDSVEDADLFEDDDIKPARQLEEELKLSKNNIQNIEATLKQVKQNTEPPSTDSRYNPPAKIENLDEKRKLVNDITMGYHTCHGITQSGEFCVRRAKKDKKMCGLHSDQE